jgi:hypothetical protein
VVGQIVQPEPKLAISAKQYSFDLSPIKTGFAHGMQLYLKRGKDSQSSWGHKNEITHE